MGYQRENFKIGIIRIHPSTSSKSSHILIKKFSFANAEIFYNAFYKYFIIYLIHFINI